jgi:hypothetical protein
MTDETYSKPKRGMPDHRKAWHGYVALLIAFGVCIFLLICVDAVMDFPDERGTPIFYPLLRLKQPPNATIFWGGVSIFLMGLIGFAILKRARVASVFMFILVWGVVAYGSLTIYADADTTKSTLSQSILHADHVYHLFYIQDMHASERTTHAYTVVKCDSLSLICQYISTPYYLVTTMGEGASFDKSGRLFIDEIYRTLNLRVGNEVYSVSDWSDRPW